MASVPSQKETQVDLRGHTVGSRGHGQGPPGGGVREDSGQKQESLCTNGRVTPTPQFCHLQNGNHPSAQSLLQQGSAVPRGTPCDAGRGRRVWAGAPRCCGGSLLACSDLPPPSLGAPAGALRRTMEAGPSTAALAPGASCCNTNAPGSVSGPRSRENKPRGPRHRVRKG